MLGREIIKQMAIQKKTTEINIAREYIQHLFLSFFYQERKSEQVLFKGGTALRIAYLSPRFSEDLDFSGFNIKIEELETMLINIMSKLDKMGVILDLSESKKTSGGYIGAINAEFSGYKTRILLEVSFRKRKTKIAGEPMLIASDFLPPYTISILPSKDLIDEKLSAVLTRAKARDYYDLYFLLRKGLITVEQRKCLNSIKEKIKNDKVYIEKELKDFLPADQQKLIRNFNEILLREVSQYV